MGSHTATAWENPRDLKGHFPHLMEKGGPKPTLASARKVHNAAMTISMSAPPAAGRTMFWTPRRKAHLELPGEDPLHFPPGCSQVRLAAFTPHLAVSHLAAALLACLLTYLLSGCLC